MPKVTISFQLPEEAEEHETTMHALDYRMALFNFDQWLRSELKYNDKLTDQEGEIYDKVRAKLWECINEEDCII